MKEKVGGGSGDVVERIEAAAAVASCMFVEDVIVRWYVL